MGIRARIVQKIADRQVRTVPHAGVPRRRDGAAAANAGAIAGAIAVTAATVTFAAAPPAPTDVSAVTTYKSDGSAADANRKVTVRWKAGDGTEDQFIIERSVDGGGFAPVATVAGTDTSWMDAGAKDLTKKYTYRVKGKKGTDVSAASATFGGGIGVTWIMKGGSHQMLTGMGDGDPEKDFGRGFHEGVDVWVDGKGGHDVVIARAGKIIKNDADDGGFITVEVDVNGSKEYDSYLHVSNRTGKAAGAYVAEGETIGKISNTHFSANDKHHLHFDIADDSSPDINDMKNPFMRFRQAADRDPLGKKPGLSDTNGDGKKVIIARSGKTTPPGNLDDITKDPVKGDVDIIADARDQMNDTLKGPAAPHKIGYHVKSLFEISVDPRNLRVGQDPYVLAQFDDDFFANLPKGSGGNDRSFFQQVYADDGSDGNPSQDLRVDPNPTGFPATMQYIVTNTKGDTGNVDKIDKDEYWNTNAKDIPNRSDTDDEANFAGDPDATKNAEARFKDGDWEIHITLEDLVNPVQDVVAGKIRLDNFTQTSMPGIGGMAPAGGDIFALYDNNDAFLTEFETETAGIDLKIGTKEILGVSGAEYYPDMLLKATIFAHKPKWTEDDSLGGALGEILVMSDASGMVPLTRFGTVADLGLTVGTHYDLIIDYDRDGLFSATLDGLSGFKVIPVPMALPSGILLLILARLAIALRHRRR